MIEGIVSFQPLHPDVILPNRAFPGDVGLDLYSYGLHRIVWPHEPVNIPTGVAMALPEGFYATIVARSSTYRRHGVLVLPGVIDAGYRGELFVQIVSSTNDQTVIEPGTRIAQLIIQRMPIYAVEVVDELPPGERGLMGFGSTG